MPKPYVISINAVSGGGKTTVAGLLSQSLGAALFAFDDFEDTNVYPDDFSDWTMRGANLLEFDCAGMRRAVDAALKAEMVAYIVMDYPFGHEHPRFKGIIDLAVFIDTPLDVALARRIIRDFSGNAGGSPDRTLHSLREEMDLYLKSARAAYLDTGRHRRQSDLVLDGCLSAEELGDGILAKLAEEGRLVSKA